MKKNLILCILAFCGSLLVNSCSIFSSDLEDEDFYLVENNDGKKTYKKKSTKTATPKKSATPKAKGKMNVTLCDKDNRKLYDEIAKWYGTPYKYGGCSEAGIDCSCFVGKIYLAVYGINLNRVAADITKNTTLIDRDELREGDVVFFITNKKYVSHVGIYLKEDMFAHASSSKGVTISKLTEKYWEPRFYKGGRHSKVQTKWR